MFILNQVVIIFIGSSSKVALCRLIKTIVKYIHKHPILRWGGVGNLVNILYICSLLQPDCTGLYPKGIVIGQMVVLPPPTK